MVTNENRRGTPQGQQKPERIGRRRQKSTALVEAHGYPVLGTDDKRPDSGNLPSLEGPQSPIAKKGTPKTPPLPPSIDGKTAKHHDRYRVRHVPPDSAGSIDMGDGAGCKAIIAKHRRTDAGNIRAGSTVLVVAPSPLPEPVVERRDTGVKYRQVITLR